MVNIVGMIFLDALQADKEEAAKCQSSFFGCMYYHRLTEIMTVYISAHGKDYFYNFYRDLRTRLSEDDFVEAVKISGFDDSWFKLASGTYSDFESMILQNSDILKLYDSMITTVKK